MNPKPFRLSFRMGSDKVSLNKATATQSPGYGGYPASNAFAGGSKFTHTTNKMGQWWKVSFNGGPQWVW
jgi:hypothetical protein